MAKQKIIVDGTAIKINREGYVSLADIARWSVDGVEPIVTLWSWLKNSSTFLFLQQGRREK